MIEGRPSGIVMKRRMTSPCWKVSRICAGVEPAGSRNSPALIGSPLPRIRAHSRNASAELISPSCSSCSATEVTVAPEGTMKVVSSLTREAPHHPHVEAATSRASTATSAPATAQPLRFTARASGDLLHHEAGVGAAEAEAVVEHRANLPLLGGERHEVDALAAVRRVLEVERRRDDLVAQREDAEDRFDRAGAAEQVTDRRLGRTHRDVAYRVAEQAADRAELELVAERSRSAVGVDVVDVGRRQAGLAQCHLHRTVG